MVRCLAVISPFNLGMATLGEFGYLADYLLPGGTFADQSVGGSHFAVAFGLIFFTSVLPYVVLTSS